MIAELQQAVEAFGQRIGMALDPFRDAVERLTAIPGVSTTTARVILAEIGTDVTRFPTAGHLISRAGLICPRLDDLT
jgi:transposase